MGTVLAVGSTNAAIVFGNLGSNGTDPLAGSGNIVTTTAWWATGFIVATPNIYLNSATIGLSGTGTIQLSLYTDNAGTPGSLQISDAVSITSSSAPTTTFNFQSPLSSTLTSGASYWLVASAVSGNATWAFANSGNPPNALNSSGWQPTTPGGLNYSGSAWAPQAFAALSSISIDATTAPIPEPGTWAAMAIFAGGAAYAGWRRRQQLSVA